MTTSANKINVLVYFEDESPEQGNLNDNGFTFPQIADLIEYFWEYL